MVLKSNPCYLQGKKIRVQGLMLHSVGCPQPSAAVFVRNWNTQQMKVCVHAFIDGDTGKVYQTLPWEYKGWHCGGSGNNMYIGVEMCEPSSIRYSGGAAFTCSDEAAALAVVKRTYNAAVQLFAFLCKQYNLDPLADGVIISHNEGHKRGVASGHGDPEHLWNGLHSGYTMDGFRQAIKAAMGTAPRAAEKKSEEKCAVQEQTKEIHSGDTVSLSPDAMYYNGKSIPGWVKNTRWIVKSVKGDRAVIDRSTDGACAINSPVNIKYLTVTDR